MKSKGSIAALQEIFFDYYYNKKFVKYNFHFSAPNSSLSSETAREEVAKRAKGMDPTVDSPTSYYFVFKFFRKLNLPKSKINLLDIGCGSGKILVTGMFLGFNKVTGIDLGEESLKRATENCKKAEIFSHTKYQIVSCDAAEYPIPPDVNVIYMYNPFYAVTMQCVINNIITSFNSDRRIIYIIYYGPLFARLFDAMPEFRRIYTSTVKSGKINVIIYKIQ